MTPDAGRRRLIARLIAAGLLCAAASCGRSRPPVTDPAADARTAAEYVAQADQLYAGREDLNNIRRAVILLAQARAYDPGSYDAAWRLAKFDSYLATHTDERDSREKAFREGIRAGKDAVSLKGDRPEGHFWLGANYGQSAEAGLLLATVDDIRNEMETVLRLDEGYQDGSAHMVLGLVYLKAPGLLGGDPRKAVEEMEKGLRFGEGNAFLRLHLAEAYLAVGRKADARRQLEAILSMTPDPNYLPEYKEAAAAARRMLEQTG
ncbi:MAG TPA: TRAP transporter TatT component family protein [Pyrinomonadaceae bacterium]|nr:TRAP transporter TatT component family protein [Pyrinomonadaceae bacterium]